MINTSKMKYFIQMKTAVKIAPKILLTAVKIRQMTSAIWKQRQLAVMLQKMKGMIKLINPL